jgi:hypothetical protein
MDNILQVAQGSGQTVDPRDDQRATIAQELE